MATALIHHNGSNLTLRIDQKALKASLFVCFLSRQGISFICFQVRPASSSQHRLENERKLSVNIETPKTFCQSQASLKLIEE